MILTEGILRKWVFPSFQQIFFFVRDPFVLAAYFMAFKYNLKPKSKSIFAFLMTILIIITIFVFFQSFYTRLPWYILFYSWRTHFFMIPLAIIMGDYLKKSDFDFLFINSLKVLPFYSILVYWQSISSKSHFINAGFRGVFKPLGVGSMVRTEGFFTSSVGNAIFITSLFVILYYLSSERESAFQKLTKGRRLFYGLCLMLCVGVSGQRLTFLQVGIVGVSILIAEAIRSNRRLKQSLQTIAVFTVIFFTIIVFALPKHFSMIRQRFVRQEFSTGEFYIGIDIIPRILYGFTAFWRYYVYSVPGIGFGIGSCSGAARRISTSMGMREYPIPEGEWARHIVELGPIVGFLLIIVRITAFIGFAAVTLRHAYKNKMPASFIFYSFISPYLLFAQLTSNGIASGFTWFYMGVVLALKNSEEQQIEG
jgi:hypothetical protein